ncbi:hypothetical protein HDE_06701 [Halotydeus destructor]|nr:hypothetical protein HDE_06701 [Halotydeus destructor]
MSTVSKECSKLYKSIDAKAIYLPQDSLDSDNQSQLLTKCRIISTYISHLSLWAPEYDFLSVESNGYHSWLRVLSAFAKTILKSCEHDGVCEALIKRPDLLIVAKILLSGLGVIEKLRADSIAQSLDSPENAEVDINHLSGDFQVVKVTGGRRKSQLLLFSQYDAFAEALITYNETMSSILADYSFRDVLAANLILIKITFGNSLSDYLTTPASMVLGDVAMATVKNVLCKSWSSCPVGTIKTVRVPECKWTVQIDEQMVKRVTKQPSSNQLQIHYGHDHTKTGHTGRDIILNLTDNHCDKQLTSLTKRAPVIEVVTNMTDVKCPKVHQIVLDVYMWLCSDAGSEKIGFPVERIIICGTGYGGNVALAICCIINEIRESEYEVQLPFPAAVIFNHSPFLLTATSSPSRLLSLFTKPQSGLKDIKMAAQSVEGPFAECGNAHQRAISRLAMPVIRCLHLVSADCMTKSMEFVSKYVSGDTAVDVIRDRTWNSSDSVIIHNKLLHLNEVARLTILSPLKYAELINLDIQFYIVTSTMDTYLDDAVHLGKLCKHHVTIDVVDKEKKLGDQLAKVSSIKMVSRVDEALNL